MKSKREKNKKTDSTIETCREREVEPVKSGALVAG